MYYRWIDTKKPDWAVTEIRERGRRAWASLDVEERHAKAEAEEKAEQEREWQEYCVKQRAFLDEMKKKTEKRDYDWRRFTDSDRRPVRLRGR